MKPCFVSPILAKVAKEEGIQVLIEPRYGYVGCFILPNGSKRYFRSTIFDLNGSGATEVAVDKDYASFFLKNFGYPIPDGEPFFSDTWAKAIGSERDTKCALQYGNSLGYPLIIKPNSASQGRGVSKVWNESELRKAMRSITNYDRVFLIQRPLTGRDYRIVVLDDEVISAYERLPLTVTGDGKSSIKKLLQIKQVEFDRIDRDTEITLNDPRLKLELKHQNMNMRTVLSVGQVVRLLSNANLSSGGDAIDVTDSVHDQWKSLAVRIAKDMNLRYIGIDVMLSAATLSDKPADYVVIEVNAAPGLDNYASIGDKQQKIVEELYRKVLRAMIA